jgi:hypothetical protein
MRPLSGRETMQDTLQKYSSVKNAFSVKVVSPSNEALPATFSKEISCFYIVHGVCMFYAGTTTCTCSAKVMSSRTSASLMEHIHKKKAEKSRHKMLEYVLVTLTLAGYSFA